MKKVPPDGPRVNITERWRERPSLRSKNLDLYAQRCLWSVIALEQDGKTIVLNDWDLEALVDWFETARLD
jgi:hypothetical protein